MKKGYAQKKYDFPTKRYVQMLELNCPEDAIREYRKWHSEEYNWKEIRDGIREVGILEMELYILGNRLVMIVDAPMDFGWEEAMDRLATLPRQAEWEAFAKAYQDSFNAQIALFPAMIQEGVQEYIDKYSVLEDVKAWKMPGAGGGGYLALVVDDAKEFCKQHTEGIVLTIRR